MNNKVVRHDMKKVLRLCFLFVLIMLACLENSLTTKAMTMGNLQHVGKIYYANPPALA